MINILEKQFDLPSLFSFGRASPLGSEASRLANGFGKLTIKKIKEHS